MMFIYHFLTWIFAPAFSLLLQARLQVKKEDPLRVHERRGMASFARPEGRLLWVHAASVGEAQSALILIKRLLNERRDIHVLVTSGTVTSAALMSKNLPERAFHHYYPLDRPDWVVRFLDHWKPDFILWMESELWPNMLRAIKKRGIPAALVNARMSARSARRWSLFKNTASSLLSAFSLILAQTETDRVSFAALGHDNILVSGNLKFSASPLPYDTQTYKKLYAALRSRPIWLYASTHAGEETLACAVHHKLSARYPDLLTIIVPRHPERREAIRSICDNARLTSHLRSQDSGLPDKDCDVYIADTLGELGLFYKLSPISVIGRSFSDDGGGGHNPIEAAQMGSAVLTGPGIQFQRDIFDAMFAADAAILVDHKDHLAKQIDALLSNPVKLKDIQERGKIFVTTKELIIDDVVKALISLLDKGRM